MCVEGIIVVTATDVIVTWFKVLGSELLEAEESTVFWTVELDLDGELSVVVKDSLELVEDSLELLKDSLELLKDSLELLENSLDDVLEAEVDDVVELENSVELVKSSKLLVSSVKLA